MCLDDRHDGGRSSILIDVFLQLSSDVVAFVFDALCRVGAYHEALNVRRVLLPSFLCVSGEGSKGGA